MFTDINTKRFITGVLSLLVFTFVFTTLVTPIVPGSLPWLLTGVGGGLPVVFGQLIVAGVITYLYASHLEGKGVSEGVKFGAPVGLLLGLVFIGGALSGSTIELGTVLTTLLVMLAYGIMGGVVLSATYPKK